MPGSISLTVIQSHLSFYGNVTEIQEVANLPSTQREVLCTFDTTANLRLLDHIWAVNIQGYNISLAKAHYNNHQLAYRKHHVAGFRGFNYKTTESQALRTFRPYGGMTYYFHQNLAYIAFKFHEQMIAACNLRLYTDDDRLLTGRPRIDRYSPSTFASDNTQNSQHHNAMSYQSHSYPDLHVNQQPNPRNIKQRTVRTHTKQDTHMTIPSEPAPYTSKVTQQPDQHTTARQDQMCQIPYTTQKGPNSPLHPRDCLPTSPSDTTSQLDLILAKLSELDAIKQHINNLDSRLDLIQSPFSYQGSVANRS